MPTATFIIEGRCYGTAATRLKSVHDELHEQESVVYLCPICGEAWARVIVPGERFWAVHVACRRHRFATYEVPGSLWLSWDPDLCAIFPLAVMEREFDLAAAHFTRDSTLAA